MSRPSTLLRWANAVTGGFPGRSEPNDGKKDQGFDDGEAPAAGEHNWIFGVAGDWITYLDQQATRLLTAALTTAANTFTVGPQAVNDTDASHAAVVTRTIAGDDSHVSGANLWKAVLGFNVGTYYVNIYVGRVSGSQQFLIAINGVWNPTTQLWSSDDSSKDSMALIMAVNSVRISRRAAAAGTWSTWPTNDGNLYVGGLLTAGDFAYATPATRMTVIPLCAQSNGWINDSDGKLMMKGTLTSQLHTFVAVRLVAYASMQTLEIVHGDVANSFYLSKAKFDWSTMIETSSALGPGATATVGGYQVTTISLSGQAFDPTAEYHVTCIPGTPGNWVAAMRLTWIDTTGPRND